MLGNSHPGLVYFSFSQLLGCQWVPQWSVRQQLLCSSFESSSLVLLLGTEASVMTPNGADGFSPSSQAAVLFAGKRRSELLQQLQKQPRLSQRQHQKPRRQLTRQPRSWRAMPGRACQRLSPICLAPLQLFSSCTMSLCFSVCTVQYEAAQ